MSKKKYTVITGDQWLNQPGAQLLDDVHKFLGSPSMLIIAVVTRQTAHALRNRGSNPPPESTFL
jgi:hypothetical protein